MTEPATADPISFNSTVWVNGNSAANPTPTLSPTAVSPSVYSSYLSTLARLDSSPVKFSDSLQIPLFSSHQTDILERSFELFIQLDHNNDHKLDLLELVEALNLFASQIRADPVRLDEAAMIMDAAMSGSETRDPPFLTFS